MQISTLSAPLGIGSKLVDCYRDSTFVAYGPLLIDLSPRTDDLLRYCTNTGSISSKFYIPNWLKQAKFLDDEHTKSLYSPSVSIIFPEMQSLFLQSCPKEFIRFLCECVIDLLKGFLQSIKRHHVAKIESDVRLLSLKRTTCKQRRIILVSEKGLQLIKVVTPPILNHLT